MAPLEIDDRDLETLEFLAEHRLAVAPQVAVLLGVTGRTADARLRRLAARGLISRQRIFDGLPATCQITRKGLGVLPTQLGAPRRPDLSNYEHDVGVGWLWLAAQRGTFGTTGSVVSEREMRSHDWRPDQHGRHFGVGLGGVDRYGRAQLHYPDLLLETASGKRVAIELELRGKGPARLARIMAAYASDSRIDAVLYLTEDKRLAERIGRAARRAGIGDLVHVQPLASRTPVGAPSAGRTPARRRSATNRTAEQAR